MTEQQKREQLADLQEELIRAKQLRGLLGHFENGRFYEWTGADNEIRDLRNLIWEIELELGIAEVQPDDF
jgi:hypothetical protein